VSIRAALFSRTLDERGRQDEKHGIQHWPLGNEGDTRKHYESVAAFYRAKLTAARPEAGEVSWHDILMEEVAEVFAETDHRLVIEELIQVAAVALAIAEDVSLRGLA
jgi:hypothetical protein